MVEEGTIELRRAVEDAGEIGLCHAREAFHSRYKVALEAGDPGGEFFHGPARSVRAEAPFDEMPGHAAVERVVDEGALRYRIELCVEGGGVDDGRDRGARHVDDRRDAAARRFGRAVEEVLAMGETGLVEVDVGIDRSRQDHETGGVDDLFAGTGGEALRYLGDRLALDSDRGAAQFLGARQGDEPVRDQHGRLPSRKSRTFSAVMGRS